MAETQEDLVGDARKNMFFDATTPSEVLGELAGYASLCWKDVVVDEGKYGRPDKKERVFDSERASKAVDQALDRLKELGFIEPENEENI